jgi:pSer/pThr/pTyr-binding forkhead associated (FHA) protein
MTSKFINSKFMEGRSYVIGRAGQLRIVDSSVSRSHATITFEDGMIKLRDLGSTNGTLVEKTGRFVPCQEAHVSLNTRLKIGNGIYSVKGLLATSGIYAVSHDNTDFTIHLSRPIK